MFIRHLLNIWTVVKSVDIAYHVINLFPLYSKEQVA